MITCVGRFLRKIRINKGEILKTMADNLGVSSAFLSAIENGKKKLPDTWYPKLRELYDLSTEQMDELRQAVIESNDTVEINIRNASAGNRQLAISFACQFDTLDEETSKKLFNILSKHKED